MGSADAEALTLAGVCIRYGALPVLGALGVPLTRLCVRSSNVAFVLAAVCLYKLSQRVRPPLPVPASVALR